MLILSKGRAATKVSRPANKNPASLAAPYMAAHTDKKPRTDKLLDKWFARLMDSGY